MIKTYYLLTKPGIILGNLITTAGGFALASKGHINIWLFLMTLVGLSLTIASACVFNNYIDRDIDGKMERTKDRALVKKLISGPKALFFAIFMGCLGIAVLGLTTNPLTVSLALFGFFAYVVLYYVCKYRSIHGTFVGSLSGAMPPVIGYSAVSHQLDVGALILFLIVLLWQMPHFFAIAIYRLEDYSAASIPVLPAKRGMRATKIQMLLYMLAFFVVTLTLTLYGYTGSHYLIVAAVTGLGWLCLCVKGFTAKDDKRWARQIFISSLVIIVMLFGMISFDFIEESGSKSALALSSRY